MQGPNSKEGREEKGKKWEGGSREPTYKGRGWEGREKGKEGR